MSASSMTSILTHQTQDRLYAKTREAMCVVRNLKSWGLMLQLLVEDDNNNNNNNSKDNVDKAIVRNMLKQSEMPRPLALTASYRHHNTHRNWILLTS